MDWFSKNANGDQPPPDDSSQPEMPLPGDSSEASANLNPEVPTEIKAPEELSDFELRRQFGNALFLEQGLLILELQHPFTSLTFQPDKEILLGRANQNSEQIVSVNLTPFDGRAKGVSRSHASIIRMKHVLMLTDLESTNGTYLNGEKIPPLQSRILRDGDEIRLGGVVLRVRFQPPTS